MQQSQALPGNCKKNRISAKRPNYHPDVNVALCRRSKRPVETRLNKNHQLYQRETLSGWNSLINFLGPTASKLTLPSAEGVERTTPQHIAAW